MTEVLQHELTLPAADVAGIVRETVRACLSSRLLIICDGRTFDDDPSASIVPPEKFEQWLDAVGRAALARMAAMSRQHAVAGAEPNSAPRRSARCAQCGALATCITVSSSGVEWPACDSHATAKRRNLE